MPIADRVREIHRRMLVEMISRQDVAAQVNRGAIGGIVMNREVDVSQGRRLVARGPRLLGQSIMLPAKMDFAGGHI